MALHDERVLIIGAGPAGMTLAYLLARRGVPVTVLETHHDFSRTFRGEGLQRSGIDAFRQMGLAEQFDRVPQIELKTIEIYFGGQQFIEGALAKIAAARAIIDASGRPIRLEVDGGIKVGNIASVAAAGADTFVGGSAIFGSKDY